MKSILIKILDRLIKILNSIINKLSVKESLEIISLTYSETGRFLLYHLYNGSLMGYKDVLFAIYTTLMNDKKFLEFGNKKVIIVGAVINNEEFSFHHNVLITNNITFDEYFNSVKDIIVTNYQDGYPVDIIPLFKVRV